MTKAVITAPQASVVEQVLLQGDLSKLTAPERVSYYKQVCESVGLNPLTKPFEYITLNGKLTLYALKACTDQLRTVHGISVEDMMESERDGVFIVTAKVKNKEGRTDMSKGAVSIKGMSGEALANALMKTETKAKRRATLSICGLGFLDETEVETIPGAKIGEPPAAAEPKVEVIRHEPGPTPTSIAKTVEEYGKSKLDEELPAMIPKIAPPSAADIADARSVFESVKKMVTNAIDQMDIDQCLKDNSAGLKRLLAVSEPNYNKLKQIVQDKRFALAAQANSEDQGFDPDTGEIPA